MLILHLLWSTSLSFIIEYLFFVIVDRIAKFSLKQSRDEIERRSLWKYQSLLLLSISFAIHVFHHFPLVLLSLTIITFLSSCDRDFKAKVRTFIRQVLVAVIYCFQSIKTYLVSIVNCVYKSYYNVPDVSCGDFVEIDVKESSFDVRNVKAPRSEYASAVIDHYPTISEDSQPYHWLGFGNTNSRYDTELRRRSLEEFRRGNSANMGNAAVVCASAPWLRRSQHDVYSAGHKHGASVSPVIAPDKLSSTASTTRVNPVVQEQTVKNRLMTFLGRSIYGEKPPGMKNSGRNICFVNSVLQCLFRTPGLSQAIYDNVKTIPNISSPESDLIAEMLKLMDSSKVCKVSALDSFTFCQAGSLLNPALIADAALEQAQQDVAEFLLWLFYVLHASLNVKVKAASPQSSPLRSFPQLNNDRKTPLGLLKHIYRDLTPHAVEALILECQQQIELSGNLDHSKLAEPLQRLSDLQWMTYKDKNSSPVDDMFTGQLIEVQHCMACNRISVSTQTFSMLPVPLLTSKTDSRLPVVRLEDCFQKFTTAEKLQGGNGLLCPCKGYQAVREMGSPSISSQRLQWTPDTAGRSCRLGSVDSNYIQKQSNVIAPGTSVVRDNFTFGSDPRFRTSTPVESPAIISRSTGQRVTLLRQLPECLVVQLLRFTFDQVIGSSRKIHLPVEIPLVLNLSSFVFDASLNPDTDTSDSIGGHTYELYGVCVHVGSGNTFTGHYVAYTKSESGPWYKYDDEYVSSVNISFELRTKLLRENSYLLFYRLLHEAELENPVQ